MASACALLAGAETSVLWHDPGRPETYDFLYGPGGRAYAPKPPFRYHSEDKSGTFTKIWVIDGGGRKWNVKFGPEARPESVSYKLAWACGYWVQPMYMVRRGFIQGMRKLDRPHPTVQREGNFEFGRFQYRDPRYRFLEDQNWSWSYNPFLGKPQLQGLKILLILTSNWDNKDARDKAKGVNTAIFSDNLRKQHVYAFTDWGQTLGRWGTVGMRTVWDCAGFTGQNGDFIRGFRDDEVDWGYGGRHADFRHDITISDVEWLMRYLGRITDAQMHAGLLAAGATPQEAGCFTEALRDRIERLRHLRQDRRISAQR